MICFKKVMTGEDFKTLAIELSTMSQFLGRLVEENREMRREISRIETKLSDKVREELDTTQKRYITMLEGKLVQFDQEAKELKVSKEIEYQRLNSYFYAGARP